MLITKEATSALRFTKPITSSLYTSMLTEVAGNIFLCFWLLKYVLKYTKYRVCTTLDLSLGSAPACSTARTGAM